MFCKKRWAADKEKAADPKTGGILLANENREEDQGRCADGKRRINADSDVSVEP